MLVEAAAFFADHEVRIQLVLTDNAKAYTESVVFAETTTGLGITLKRTPTLPTPDQRQGRAFNRTLLDGGHMPGCITATPRAARAFTRWMQSYNHRRPHTSLDGLTPMTVLVNNDHRNDT